MKKHNILVIDKTPRDLFAIGQILESGTYQTTLAQNAESGLESIRNTEFALAIVEFKLGSAKELELLEAIQKESPRTMVLLQCDGVGAKAEEDLFQLKVDDIIFRPYIAEELLFRVKKNTDRYELSERIASQKTFFSNCCVCKKMRVDDNGPVQGRWKEVEDFLKEEMGILLSSTYCPKCAQTAQEDLLVHIDRLKA